MTWEYAAPWEIADNIPDEYVWERLRLKRNEELTLSDWRVVSDAEWDIAPWVEYRKALRALPANTSDPRQAIWPVPPS